MKGKEKSELIINPDGTIYHLKLKPENIAQTIIIVGDPNRVDQISGHFDDIELEVKNREFVTHTGTYRGKRLSVLATGIGTDNIDIVVNELDALVNYDLETRGLKKNPSMLNIIRLGTSGAIQEDIPLNSFIIAEYGLGLDGLIHFYEKGSEVQESKMEQAFIDHTKWSEILARPYIVKCSEFLMNKLGKNMISGITVTSPGFYGPQGRRLRLELKYPYINKLIESFEYNGSKITNYEMETSALYAIAKMLGHNAITICAAIANRATGQFNENYKVIMDAYIVELLDKLVQENI